MHKGAHVRILDALGEENGDTPVACKDYCKATMVASEQDTESDVDKAWDTRENAASEHSNSVAGNSDASSTTESNNERSLALSSNEVEEHELFSMAAEEGSDIKKAKEYDESELEDAAVKIQKVHRGRKAERYLRKRKGPNRRSV